MPTYEFPSSASWINDYSSFGINKFRRTRCKLTDTFDRPAVRLIFAPRSEAIPLMPSRVEASKEMFGSTPFENSTSKRIAFGKHDAREVAITENNIARIEIEEVAAGEAHILDEAFNYVHGIRCNHGTVADNVSALAARHVDEVSEISISSSSGN